MQVGLFRPSLVVQTNALIASDGEIDYRKASRKFKELPDALFDDNLQEIIFGGAELTKKARPTVRKFNISIHSNVIYCHPKQVTTNSPDGIHQDGVDFIISV